MATDFASFPLSLLAILVLALLSAVAPLATDMYLPAFPEMARDLGTGAAAIQVTLTSFLLGLAAGQLVIGPLSDRFGRRQPLLIGTAVCVLSGLLCAVAPNVESLIVLRLVQGFGGAAGIVLARAVIADRTSDATVTARLFQLMMIIGGLAPVLAPIVGTAIVAFAGWRTVLAVIALLSMLSFFGVVRFVEETLPPERRTPAGLRALLSAIRSVLSSRAYVGYTLTTGFAFTVMFAYIAASPFVFQKVLGLSPAAYSIAFGTNAVGLLTFAGMSAKLVGRIPPRRLTAIGLGVQLITAVSLFGVVLVGSGAAVVLPLVFVTVASVGPILGNASALALSEVRDNAGTASAALGALQFFLGAIASPLVGLGGEDSALPMTAAMVVAAGLAIVSFVLLTRRTHAAPAAPHSLVPKPHTELGQFVSRHATLSHDTRHT
ncbi:multidrug effflux MFS transporter [Bradyrhizobium liaoningense]|uniref:multidrug effflux MFS transporter n=1 Tax=Bradyrhizobium liaoningense TaxID=43992 RepID=UPI001BA4F01D|nr:multidrug effflux MFS transporter [Bradyrhizobium liaoningense]MBR0706994.1 multidrug effflux MFS transporter [Bradyrhizobium liaoningense]